MTVISTSRDQESLHILMCQKLNSNYLDNAWIHVSPEMLFKQQGTLPTSLHKFVQILKKL